MKAKGKAKGKAKEQSKGEAKGKAEVLPNETPNKVAHPNLKGLSPSDRLKECVRTPLALVQRAETAGGRSAEAYLQFKMKCGKLAYVTGVTATMLKEKGGYLRIVSEVKKYCEESPRLIEEARAFRDALVAESKANPLGPV